MGVLAHINDCLEVLSRNLVALLDCREDSELFKLCSHLEIIFRQIFVKVMRNHELVPKTSQPNGLVAALPQVLNLVLD